MLIVALAEPIYQLTEVYLNITKKKQSLKIKRIFQITFNLFTNMNTKNENCTYCIIFVLHTMPNMLEIMHYFDVILCNKIGTYFVRRNIFYMVQKWWQMLKNLVENNQHTLDDLYLCYVAPLDICMLIQKQKSHYTLLMAIFFIKHFFIMN